MHSDFSLLLWCPSGQRIERRSGINKMAPLVLTPVTATLKSKENCQKRLCQNPAKESKVYNTQANTDVKIVEKLCGIFTYTVPCPHGHGITLLEGNLCSWCGTDPSSGKIREALNHKSSHMSTLSCPWAIWMTDARHSSLFNLAQKSGWTSNRDS